MSFDQEVRRSLDSVAGRLRGEIERELEAVVADLRTSVETERAAAAAQAAATARVEAEQAAAQAAADARREAEQATAQAVADVRREMEQAAADARREAEQATAQAVADVRREMEQTAAQVMADVRREAEQRAAQAVADVRREMEQTAAQAVADVRREAERAATEARTDAAQDLADARREAEEAMAEARSEAAQEVADARNEVEQATGTALRTSELAASERLADAIRGMDRARSLSEILDTLASCAGREAARVSVLLVREGDLRSWRFIGFGPARDEAGSVALPVSDAGILAEAVRTGSTISGDSAARATAPAFARLPPGREMLAVPLPMSGQVVAVLYADQGIDEPADADLRVTWPATLEVMARHAARCLEAVTAFRAAQVLTERPDVPIYNSQVTSYKEAGPEVSVEEEQAARRYARLLISEIRLYHEAEVIAGRRERDLATRLGGEIARARSLYEQRVPQTSLASHFEEELIRTLASGDASLLTVVSQKSEGRS